MTVIIPTLAPKKRRKVSRSHGMTKTVQDAIKAWDTSKKEIESVTWPPVRVSWPCRCMAHSFPHYHPGQPCFEEKAVG